MKKTIAVVALDPMAGASYKNEVESLFGEYADVLSYSVRDGSATGKLPWADLFVISTDAYGSPEEITRHVPIDCESMAIEVSFRWSALEALWKIPTGESVLFVNVTEAMAREAIAQLASLGVNHLKFIPYYPGGIINEAVELAVTPGENRYIPKSITKIIDTGHRSCTSGMMIEIALRLGMEHLLETEVFQNYFKSIATNNYSFDQMFARSRKLESQFHILMDILDEGLVGVNERGQIFACNKNACQIAKVSEQLIIGKLGEEVFPYIPFYSVLKDKKQIQARVTKILGVNISIAVIPVLRKQECIGAFATLQRFNDLETKQNELRSQLLSKGHFAKYTFEDILGKSDVICRTKDILKRMAVTQSPVLIVGETGTGKELMAHAVHQASKRSKGPFIAINVAAMPENLLESELFGYEEGAFTGAKKGGKLGVFEFAHNGTLFLDEVEGMSLSMQVKLLRVLQEGEVMRIGGSSIVSIDVRIVAATNECLEQKVKEGSFRKDLYYRLNALTVVIPPLRDRGEDILLLLEHFKSTLSANFEISKKTKQFLLGYSWPGNIRELYNAVEYFNYTGNCVVELEDLPPTMTGIGFFAVSECTNENSNNTMKPYWFVLEQIYIAAENESFIGRDRIYETAKNMHITISQKQIRDALKELSNNGLVVTGRGRAGSIITPKGRQCWIKYRDAEI